MGRPRKTEMPNNTMSEQEKAEPVEVYEIEGTATEPVEAEEAETKTDAAISEPEPQIEKPLPADVKRLMRLYPQYAEIYITKEGFVHPADAPKFLVKDAVLYKNLYYNK